MIDDNVEKKPDAKKATTDVGKRQDMQKRILKKGSFT